MNNLKKMHRTNSIIKKYLLTNGFSNIYLFPHLRFQKDYLIDNLGFDAIGWKNNEKNIYLLQFKTNKKPSKKLLEEYKKLSKKYNCIPLWITYFNRKGVEIYG